MNHKFTIQIVLQFHQPPSVQDYLEIVIQLSIIQFSNAFLVAC